MLVLRRSCLRIVDLELSCIVGILPQERQREQRLVINAVLHSSFKEVKEYDGAVSGGVDYAAVASFVEAEVIRKKYGLLETLLQDVATQCFERFPQLEGLELRAHKPDILPNCESVGAEIEVWRE